MVLGWPSAFFGVNVPCSQKHSPYSLFALKSRAFRRHRRSLPCRSCIPNMWSSTILAGQQSSRCHRCAGRLLSGLKLAFSSSCLLFSCLEAVLCAQVLGQTCQCLLSRHLGASLALSFRLQPVFRT